MVANTGLRFIERNRQLLSRTKRGRSVAWHHPILPPLWSYFPSVQVLLAKQTSFRYQKSNKRA